MAPKTIEFRRGPCHAQFNEVQSVRHVSPVTTIACFNMHAIVRHTSGTKPVPIVITSLPKGGYTIEGVDIPKKADPVDVNPYIPFPNALGRDRESHNLIFYIEDPEDPEHDMRLYLNEQHGAFREPLVFDVVHDYRDPKRLTKIEGGPQR